MYVTAISNEFPDTTNQIPFNQNEMDHMELNNMNMKELESFVEGDFWGMQILHGDGTREPLQNTFIYRDSVSPCDFPDENDEIRETVSNFEDNVLPKVKIGDTLVVLMFGWDTWGVWATRTENDWIYSFRHKRNWRFAK